MCVMWSSQADYMKWAVIDASKTRFGTWSFFPDGHLQWQLCNDMPGCMLIGLEDELAGRYSLLMMTLQAWGTRHWPNYTANCRISCHCMCTTETAQRAVLNGSVHLLPTLNPTLIDGAANQANNHPPGSCITT
jgi:hypothetical protein